MRSFILLTIAIVCCEGILTVTKAAFANTISDEWWENYKREFGKSYATTEEEQFRKQICWQNKMDIEKHNTEFKAGRQTFEMGLNEFSDKTEQEYSASLLGYFKSMRAEDFDAEYNSSERIFLPINFDWRSKGAVTEVKHQGQCGSCWAFSSTGCLEGQYFRKTKKLLSFSEQHLVDCSKTFGTRGCSGGWMNSAFNFVKSAGGIASQGKYPYEAKDGICGLVFPDIRFRIKRIVNVRKGSEILLKKALYEKGPIAVTIDASLKSFGSYKNGVYNDKSCQTNKPNHAVLLVGYGYEKNIPYWLIKNSWGTGWGIEGYMKVARNKGNHCGIASYASYVEL